MNSILFFCDNLVLIFFNNIVYKRKLFRFLGPHSGIKIHVVTRK